MNYVEELAATIYKEIHPGVELPKHVPSLYLGYAALAFSVGPGLSPDQVHNVWVAHRSQEANDDNRLVPFTHLTQEDRDRTKKHGACIQRALAITTASPFAHFEGTRQRVKTINVASLRGVKNIELRQGDLTALPKGEGSDMLVISAFPNDYVPTPSSLIGALSKKGISVDELAKHKVMDLRPFTSCWLSEEIQGRGADLGFKRLLCFEPGSRGGPTEVVGDIFRALISLIEGIPGIQTVAMPIVATGDQQTPIATILPALLESAKHWMQLGVGNRAVEYLRKDHRGLR